MRNGKFFICFYLFFSCCLYACPSIFSDFCPYLTLWTSILESGLMLAFWCSFPSVMLRILQNQSHGQLLGLVLDSTAISLSSASPGSGLATVYFQPPFPSTASRTSPTPILHLVGSIFSSYPPARDEHLGFWNRPTGALWLQTCCFSSISDLWKGLF